MKLNPLRTLGTLHGGEKNMKKFGTCLVASLVVNLFLFEALVWAQNKEEAEPAEAGTARSKK